MAGPADRPGHEAAITTAAIVSAWAGASPASSTGREAAQRSMMRIIKHLRRLLWPHIHETVHADLSEQARTY